MKKVFLDLGPAPRASPPTNNFGHHLWLLLTLCYCGNDCWLGGMDDLLDGTLWLLFH